MSDVRRRFPEPQKTHPIIYTEEKAARLGCVSKTLLVVICLLWIIVSIIAVGYLRAPFLALPIRYPSMQIELFGSLRANKRLTEGIKITGLPGPEVLLLDGKNNIYTGLADGRIIKIEPSEEGIVGTGKITNITTGIIHRTPSTFKRAQNGRPHGLRLQDDNTLYVADGIYGIYSVDLVTHETTQMISINDVKPQMRHPKDLCFSKDGILLYFSDASSKNTLMTSVYSFLEGHPDSRVIRYNIRTRKLQVVASKLSFVNGIQLSEDEKVLYLCETFHFRVRLLDTTTWKTLKVVPLPSEMPWVENGLK